jgi:hypothetical protein
MSSESDGRLTMVYGTARQTHPPDCTNCISAGPEVGATSPIWREAPPAGAAVCMLELSIGACR